MAGKVPLAGRAVRQRPTPAVTRIIPGLRAELDRLGLRRVRLDVETGVDWQGAFAMGRDGALEIVIGAALDPMATLHHEVIHAMRHMGLFSAAEWRALELAAPAWIAEHDIAARYPGLPAAMLVEEAIAEQFAAALAQGGRPAGSAVARAFDKVLRLFEAVRNAIAGAGLQTSRGVFERVRTGEIGARSLNSQVDLPGGYQVDAKVIGGRATRATNTP
ncbi:hypothetical protein [Neotabrizicola sp. sgz301269]|uniref:hypothetical protein n=1 Tax=Neotabrizicola sp. sgz301269 TaxID=3276282 RepID=UPI00376F997C